MLTCRAVIMGPFRYWGINISEGMTPAMMLNINTSIVEVSRSYDFAWLTVGPPEILVFPICLHTLIVVSPRRRYVIPSEGFPPGCSFR